MMRGVLPESEGAFQRGLDLFHRGAFYEAHEAWEEVWRACEDPESRTLLKGLVQTAAALHHRARGAHRGAARVGAKALTHLDAGERRAPDLQIRSLIQWLRDMIDQESTRGRQRSKEGPLVPPAPPVLLSAVRAADAPLCEAGDEAGPPTTGAVRRPRSS
jgi:hypothetical protein